MIFCFIWSTTSKHFTITPIKCCNRTVLVPLWKINAPKCEMMMICIEWAIFRPCWDCGKKILPTQYWLIRLFFVLSPKYWAFTCTECLFVCLLVCSQCFYWIYALTGICESTNTHPVNVYSQCISIMSNLLLFFYRKVDGKVFCLRVFGTSNAVRNETYTFAQ